MSKYPIYQYNETIELINKVNKVLLLPNQIHLPLKCELRANLIEYQTLLLLAEMSIICLQNQEPIFNIKIKNDFVSNVFLNNRTSATSIIQSISHIINQYFVNGITFS